MVLVLITTRKLNPLIMIHFNEEAKTSLWELSEARVASSADVWASQCRFDVRWLSGRVALLVVCCCKKNLLICPTPKHRSKASLISRVPRGAAVCMGGAWVQRFSRPVWKGLLNTIPWGWSYSRMSSFFFNITPSVL
jgi:hypothetical protein